MYWKIVMWGKTSDIIRRWRVNIIGLLIIIQMLCALWPLLYRGLHNISTPLIAVIILKWKMWSIVIGFIYRKLIDIMRLLLKLWCWATISRLVLFLKCELHMIIYTILMIVCDKSIAVVVVLTIATSKTIIILISLKMFAYFSWMI
jgi:hypothetical protein